ncbi:MAG: GNAT family N-acetyltransferase [Spirulina sp. SIO3F2]|nr:GNAT family N-acetyltransferase [Spirulina sp. SIO3F2]
MTKGERRLSVLANPSLHCNGAKIHQWWQQGRVGTIAPASTTNVEQTLTYLRAECDRLYKAGYAAAIAPIARNTWHNYRCIVEHYPIGSSGRPLFWQEPDLPSHWPSALYQEDFYPIAHYYSAECVDLTQVDPRYPELCDRFLRQGVQLRSANLNRPEPDLNGIYQVAIIAFARNFLFTPIDQSEFLQRYQPLLPLLDSKWVLIAERAGAIVGFVLGLPDLLAPPTPTLILKTVACLPGRQWAGLGRWLVAAFHHRAHKQGYQRIIHALMHQANPSLNLSRRYAQPFRRYALFSKVLSQSQSSLGLDHSLD